MTSTKPYRQNDAIKSTLTKWRLFQMTLQNFFDFKRLLAKCWFRHWDFIENIVVTDFRLGGGQEGRGPPGFSYMVL